MIDVKQAVQAAKKYADELYEGRLLGTMLEEVERSPGGDWVVTLGLTFPGSSALDPTGQLSLGQFGQISKMFGSVKLYKVFTIHGNTGEVLSMKIREHAHTG